MIQFDPLAILSVIFLYAETHYRFKYFFSWLRKPEPEIIADIPSRVNADQQLPVLIIIKDANIYPVKIDRITVLNGPDEIATHNPQEYIADAYREILFYADISSLEPDLYEFDIRIEFQTGDEKRFCLNDNHRGTSHAPLPTRISKNSIPRFADCFLGEPHAHTIFTSDQVEFAGSVNSTASLARAMGLDFYCATDHSYDLDDMPDDYLTNDPELSKWHSIKAEIALFNEQNRDFLIIPGEEATLRNHNGRNIHCLVYNSQKFLPGSGDSAEKWLRWRSELTISDAVELSDKDSVIFAAHPFEKPPVLQRIFIGRDAWNDADCRTSGLSGLQFINGGTTGQTKLAKQKWVDLLLQGYRLTGTAGNDAHGNFARFRQVGFPFFTMREHYYHLFGKWFTGVFNDSGDLSVKGILAAMKAGDCYMSNGPAMRLSAYHKDKGWIRTAQEICSPAKFKIECKSSDEFGNLSLIKVFYGNPELGAEKTVMQKFFTDHRLDYLEEFEPELPEGTKYVRAEVYTDKMAEALSNPVWIRSKG